MVLLSLIFIVTLILTIYFLFKSSHESYRLLWIVVFWIILQSILSISGFYLDSDAMPPRFIFFILPPVIFISLCFAIKKYREKCLSFNLAFLTLIHTVRILIEIILWKLSKSFLVPVDMTFEGNNFDIIAGLTAPLIYYYGIKKKKIKPTIIFAWNFMSLALLLNVVYLGVFSAPSPIQLFAFEIPNRAMLQFPFVLLPAFIVPVILFSHINTIYKLLKE